MTPTHCTRLVALLIPLVVFVMLAPLQGQGDSKGQRYALLVGVQTYRADSGLKNNLKYPEADVAALADLLKEGGYKSVRLLSQANPRDDRSQPRSDNIRQELGLLLGNRAAGDTVLIMFAGHGVQFKDEPNEAYFCPADARLDNRKTLLSLTQVYKELEKCGAGCKLLLSDACRNDPLDGSGRDANQAESVTRPQLVPIPKGVAAVFSCSAGQRAFERDDLGHGVFTHFLLDGLKQGKTDALDLFSYTKREVYDYVADKYATNQTPDIQGTIRGGLPLLERAPVVSQYDLTGGYRFVHFSGDTIKVVLKSYDSDKKRGFAQVLDVATDQQICRPLQHQFGVVHLAFSPDGRRVVTASSGNTGRVWDAANGEPIGAPLQHQKGLDHASFSPDGRRIITAGRDNTARVWDATTGHPIGPTLQHQDGVTCATFSPDGRYVVTASWDKTARVWDAAAGQPGPSLRHQDAVLHAAFSPDGRRIVTACWDETARVWDAATGEPIGRPLQHQDDVMHATFSPDGRRVVTASSDKTARVWDTVTGQPISSPFQHQDNVRHAAFSPDGRRVVTASGTYDGKRGEARVWDAATGQPIGLPLQHQESVARAAFSPDGRRVVTTTGDAAFVWDAASGKLLHEARIKGE